MEVEKYQTEYILSVDNKKLPTFSQMSILAIFHGKILDCVSTFRIILVSVEECAWQGFQQEK